MLSKPKLWARNLQAEDVGWLAGQPVSWRLLLAGGLQEISPSGKIARALHFCWEADVPMSFQLICSVPSLALATHQGCCPSSEIFDHSAASVDRVLCRAKPKGGICLLYKWAYTACWLCRAVLVNGATADHSWRHARCWPASSSSFPTHTHKAELIYNTTME